MLIQIGANDGLRNDHLARFIDRHRPRALLVEPQAGPFQALQQRYGRDSRVLLHQGAVAARSGERILWRCRDELPAAEGWASSRASPRSTGRSC